MLTASSSIFRNIPEGALMVTKSKDPPRGSSGNLRSIRRLSSSFLNDESLKASFTRSDRVDGNYVVSYLENNPEIQELHCEEVIQAEHLGPIHRLLVNYHHSMHLHILELPRNQLAADAGNDLANILTSQQQTLFKLDLSGNPLTVAGISPLLEPLITESSPSRLRILNLSNTELGSKGAKLIASILRSNKSLQELYLRDNSLGLKGMKTIATELETNSSLKILDVSYNNITKRGASMIAEHLQNSKISSLRVLDVTGNNLGPAGLQAFADLLTFDHKIEGLYAGRNGVGAEGASMLGSALRLNYTLKELRLEANEICDAGALMLADGLTENENRTTAVEKLFLGWNEIGLEGSNSLAETLKENATLYQIDLSGNKICCAGAAALAESLSYNLSLKELNLSQNVIKDDGAYAFAMAMGKPTCCLQKLVWQDNPISADGQASLERIPQLRRNLKHWLDQLLKDISKGSVSSVNLVERNFGDEEFLLFTDTLSKSNPLIRTLWLSGTNLSQRSLMPFFQNCFGPAARILRVYIKDCRFGDDVAGVLSSVLRENTSLEVLSLNDSSLSAVGASAIAEGLTSNTKIRRLNLDRNRIGDVGMASLGQAIAKSSLQSLSVSRNALTDQSMEFESVKYLEELHMNGNQITDRGAVGLCRFLLDDCRLVWLGLRENHLTIKGGGAIKTLLPATATVDY